MKKIKSVTKDVDCSECGGKTLHFPIVKEAYINTPKRKSIKEWFEMMENLGEADITFLNVNNKSYTPREIYDVYLNNPTEWEEIKKRLVI